MGPNDTETVDTLPLETCLLWVNLTVAYHTPSTREILDLAFNQQPMPAFIVSNCERLHMVPYKSHGT